jgi:hypothetical protein
MGFDKLIDLNLLQYFYNKLKAHISSIMSSKQDILVAGENIKTINGNTILGSGDIDTGAAAYVTYIKKGERYNPSTGEIEASTDDHYRTSKIATLGNFITTFRWNVETGGTLWVHGWDTHGNYTGNLSQEIEANSTEYEWKLQPSFGDAYYAFDFISQDEDASTIYVDVVGYDVYIAAQIDYVQETVDFVKAYGQISGDEGVLSAKGMENMIMQMETSERPSMFATIISLMSSYMLYGGLVGLVIAAVARRNVKKNVSNE